MYCYKIQSTKIWSYDKGNEEEDDDDDNDDGDDNKSAEVHIYTYLHITIVTIKHSYKDNGPQRGRVHGSKILVCCLLP